MEKITPKVGDYIEPDGWRHGEQLAEADGYRDASFPGCQFRLPGGAGENLAVNVTVTGKPHYNHGSWWSRCRIEFVGDDEPSAFTGGKIWTQTLRVD